MIYEDLQQFKNRRRIKITKKFTNQNLPEFAKFAKVDFDSPRK